MTFDSVNWKLTPHIEVQTTQHCGSLRNIIESLNKNKFVRSLFHLSVYILRFALNTVLTFFHVNYVRRFWNRYKTNRAVEQLKLIQNLNKKNWIQWHFKTIDTHKIKIHWSVWVCGFIVLRFFLLKWCENNNPHSEKKVYKWCGNRFKWKVPSKPISWLMHIFSFTELIFRYAVCLQTILYCSPDLFVLLACMIFILHRNQKRQHFLLCFVSFFLLILLSVVPVACFSK